MDKKQSLFSELENSAEIDERVIDVMKNIDRTFFVENESRDLAYNDSPLSIRSGQTISQPFIVAYMTSKLMPLAGMRVLEVGSGSGYQAAVLAKLCKHVYTIERIKDLFDLSQSRLTQFKNISGFFGNGFFGLAQEAPFDRIIVTALSDGIPYQLLKQLAFGGIMILPVLKEDKSEVLVLIKKDFQGMLTIEELIGVRFVKLINSVGQ